MQCPHEFGGVGLLRRDEDDVGVAAVQGEVSGTNRLLRRWERRRAKRQRCRPGGATLRGGVREAADGTHVRLNFSIRQISIPAWEPAPANCGSPSATCLRKAVSSLLPIPPMLLRFHLLVPPAAIDIAAAAIPITPPSRVAAPPPAPPPPCAPPRLLFMYIWSPFFASFKSGAHCCMTPRARAACVGRGMKGRTERTDRSLLVLPAGVDTLVAYQHKGNGPSNFALAARLSSEEQPRPSSRRECTTRNRRHTQNLSVLPSRR
jgi:hypothetical protein